MVKESDTRKLLIFMEVGEGEVEEERSEINDLTPSQILPIFFLVITKIFAEIYNYSYSVYTELQFCFDKF